MVVLKSILCAVAKIAGLKEKEKHNLSSSSSSSLPKACILKNWNFIIRAIDLVSRFPNAGVRVRGHFWILRLYLFFCSLLKFFSESSCTMLWHPMALRGKVKFSKSLFLNLFSANCCWLLLLEWFSIEILQLISDRTVASDNNVVMEDVKVPSMHCVIYKKIYILL